MGKGSVEFAWDATCILLIIMLKAFWQYYPSGRFLLSVGHQLWKGSRLEITPLLRCNEALALSLQTPGRASSASGAGRSSPTSTTGTSTSSTPAVWTRGTGNFLATFVADPLKKGTGWGSIFSTFTRSTDLTRWACSRLSAAPSSAGVNN